MGEDDKTYSQEIQDRIRELAHSMWESAGRLQGLATEYWLAAEKEVLAARPAIVTARRSLASSATKVIWFSAPSLAITVGALISVTVPALILITPFVNRQT